MKGHGPAACLSGQLGGHSAHKSSCECQGPFSETRGHIKELNLMLPEQGQNPGTKLPLGKRCFSAS